MYDDDVVLTRSGTDTWISGVIQPINPTRSSQDAVMLAQGKILTNDLKLYVDGTVQTSGTWKVGIGGSPPAKEYTVLPEGVMAWQINGSIVYNTCYVRYLTTGSILGE